MPVCTKCGGERGEYVEEGGKQKWMPCYHCGTEGIIDDDLAFADRAKAYAETLAAIRVDRWRKECNAMAETDGNCEGWAFHAAENMMHEHDYTSARIMTETDKIMKLLEAMDQDLLGEMLAEHESHFNQGQA